MAYLRAGEEAQLTSLQTAYKTAFGRWALQTGRLKSLTTQSTSGSMAVREARGQVEAAQTAYRESRDLLAEFMLAAPAKSEARPSPSSSVAAGGTEDVPQAGTASESDTGRGSEFERPA